MPVPSAFNDILSETSALNYIGWSWYQTVMTVDNFGDQTERLFLQLESVNYMAMVFIQRLPSDKNASLVATHVGGHLPLCVDLTEWLYPSLVTNTLRVTVAVNNELTGETIPSGQMLDYSNIVGRPYRVFRPDFDFFHFAGILGDVNAIRLPKQFIENVTPLWDKDDQLKGFQVCMSNASADSSVQSMRISIEPQETVGELASFELDLFEQVEALISGDRCLSIAPPKRFMDKIDANGRLKVVEFSIFQESSQLVSEFQRKILLDRFRLKLRSSRRRTWPLIGSDLHGFGMHQEQYFSGRSMSLASIMKDVNLLKRVGANVIRTSHYPYSSEYLDACDDNDVMVIAECQAVGLNSFSKNKLELHKQLLKEMLWRDHHHPSIIMWSIANEPQSQKVEAKWYFESLVEYAKRDLAQYTVLAKRPITAAIAQPFDADRIGHTLDVLMLNFYYAWYSYTNALETIRPGLLASLNGWAKKHSGKPLLVSEFGADTLAGEHKMVRGIYTEEFQRDLIIEHERVFHELRKEREQNRTEINFIGSMIWNFADFSTHESLYRIGGINRKGIFTRDRQPKLSVNTVEYFYKLRAKPVTETSETNYDRPPVCHVEL